MSAWELITGLTRRDIRPSARGDRLHVEAPKDVLPSELLNDLRTHKP